VALSHKLSKWWQYYPRNNPNYISRWIAQGRGKYPPYRPGIEAQKALNLPKHYNPGDAVRRVRINKGEKIVGPRTPKAQPNWGYPKPGKGQEYYRGESFPN
jgi:hypothetical protein